MNNYSISTVDFHGQTIQTFLHNNEPHIVMKSVVEGMGLDWSYQRKKLSNNKLRWGVAIIAIPTKSEIQEAICMPLRKLFGWLMTIQPTRVNQSAKDAVIRYQNECDDVLFNYWSNKTAKPEQPKISNTLTEAQIGHVYNAVHAGCATVPKHERKQYFADIWGSVKRQFEVGSYREVKSSDYTKLCTFVGIVPKPELLEGELIPKANQKEVDNHVAGLAIMILGTRVKELQDSKLRNAERLFNEAKGELREAQKCSGAIFSGLYDSRMYLRSTEKEESEAKERAERQFENWKHQHCMN